MPNAKVLTEKQAIVAELTDKIKGAASGVLVDYKGITVAEDTALRAECRKNELDYAVVKNTLVRRAIDNVGMNEMDEVLNGTTSMALSNGDPIAPMRVINKFSKQFNGAKFTIKAGFMDGKVLSLDEIMALAELPSKEALQAQVLGTMLAPISSLAIVLKAIADEKGGYVERPLPLWPLPPLAAALLPLPRRRPSSTWSWLRSAPRRSRSSRPFVRSPAWVWLRPRPLSRPLPRPSRRA